MNIFILDENKSLNAQYHNDNHIVTMPTEAAKILCTTLFNVCRLSPSWVSIPHLTHGCVVWAGQSIQNFLWLCELGLCLCDEYSYRFFTPPESNHHRDIPHVPTHHAKSVILQCQGLVIPHLNKFPDQKKLTPFYLAIPDGCKCTAHKDFFENTVLSYRYYYCREVQDSQWTKRATPTWYKNQPV